MARAPRANNPIAVSANQAPIKRPTRRRWFVMAALALPIALAGGIYLAAGSQPVLRFALEQAKAGGFDIQARAVRGNLFSAIEASDASVKSAFVNGSARTIKAHYDLWALLTRRQVKLDIALEGGFVNFDPGKLPAADPKAPPPPVSVSLRSLSVQDTSVKLLNKSFFSPDVNITVLEQKAEPGDSPRGDLKLALRAAQGSGTATVHYDIGEGFATTLDIQADLDARIARYWYEPIRAGRLKGTVKITPKFVTAQARVENGVLEPLKGVLVRNVSGRANLTADTKVSALLTGEALDGPLEADIGVDISAERWSVLGRLSPSVSSALKTFAPGVTGTGRLAVTVRGGGWETVALEGTATGTPDTSVTGFELRDLKAKWSFTDHLELNGSAVSKLGSDPIQIAANLRSQGERVLVKAKASGEFLHAPLSIAANIDTLRGVTRLKATGGLLRGQLAASGSITGDRVTASGEFQGLQLPVPLKSALSGTARASGTLRDLSISGRLSPASLVVPGVRNSDLSGEYALRWNGQTLSGNAQLAQGQVAWQGAIVNTNAAPALGTLKLSGIALEPAGQASATLRYQLNSDGSGNLQGQAEGYELQFQGFTLEPASGPLRVAWRGSSLQGRWEADKLLATFDEKAVRLQPRNWQLRYNNQSLGLNGDAKLRYEGLAVSGQLSGQGPLGELRAIGQGGSLRLEGTAQYQGVKAALSGELRLQPLKLQLRAQPSVPQGGLGGSIALGFERTLTLSGSIITGQNQRLELSSPNGQIALNGNLDLRALDSVLPESARGLFSGVAQVQYSGNLGTATVRGAVSGVKLEGRVVLRGSLVSADLVVADGEWRGARLTGLVAPNVNARVAYQGISARVQGNYDDLSFTADGRLPQLAVLEQNQVRLSDPVFHVDGAFKAGKVSLRGQLGELRFSNGNYQDGQFSADLSGNLKATYQGKPVALTGLNAQLRYSPNGVSVQGQTGQLEAEYAGAKVRLRAVRMGLKQSARGLNLELQSAQGSGSYAGQALALANTALNAALNGTRLSAQVQSDLSGQWRGERAKGSLRANFGLNLERPQSDWQGELEAGLTGTDWRVRASGPWSQVNVVAVVPTAALARVTRQSLPEQLSTTLRADGVVSLPDARFQANFSTALGQGANRLRVNGKASGQGASWSVTAALRDSQNHNGSLSYDATGAGGLRVNDLNLTALSSVESRASGTLTLRGQRLRGTLTGQAATLPFRASWLEAGGFRAAVGGNFPLDLNSERWDFPLSVAPINLTSRDSKLPVSLAGVIQLSGGVRASGQLNLKAYQVNVPGGPLEILPQSLPLEFSAERGVKLLITSNQSVAVYDGSTWRGALAVRYRAWEREGQLSAKISGALSDPKLIYQSDGPIQLEGEGDLSQATLRGSLPLEPLSRVLEAGLRDKLEPGRLQFTAKLDLKNLGGVVNANLLGSAVDGQPAKLQLSAAIGDGFSAQGDLALGDSHTRFHATQDGIEASEINLDLRLLRLLGLTASGTATGAISIPQYRLERGQGALHLHELSAFGLSADGAVSLANGQLSGDLRGTLPGKLAFAVQGDLYPRADAALQLEGLSGRFSGSNLTNLNRRAALSLTGSFSGKPSALQANLQGKTLRLSGNWDALRVTASGAASEQGIALSGLLEAADLRNLAGVDGNLRGQFSFDGTALRVTGLKGNAAGFALQAEALYRDGQLSLSALRASDKDFSLSGAGQVYPKLEATLSLESHHRLAPGTATLRSSGSLEAPVVKLEGVLGAAKEGLIVPGTKLQGLFADKHWSLGLSGDQINGTVQGGLSFIEAVKLNLDAPLRYNDTELRLRGNPSWQRDAGFGGETQAQGALLGSPATLSLHGAQQLLARLEWRGGSLRATLPEQIGEALKADLELEQFDLGALWQKPDQLFLSGRGAATGAWAAPTVQFLGDLHSSEGSLDGRLEAHYASGQVNATLRGQRVTLEARLNSDGYSASGQFDRVSLSALLPVQVKALTASGEFQASGAFNGTPPSLNAQNLDLTGDLEPIGAFQASGTASLERNRVTTQLSVRALSGSFTAIGQIAEQGSNLELVLDGLKLDQFGAKGTVGGRVVLRGTPTNPSANGNLTVSGFALQGQDWGANAQLSISQQLLNPTLSGTLDLTGTASGRLQVSARDLTSDTPRLSLRGNAKLPFVSLSGNLDGTPSTLQGKLEATLPGLPVALQRITLEGDGRGNLRVQNAGINGTLTLKSGQNWLGTQLGGSLNADLKLDDALAGLGGRMQGKAELAGSLQHPSLSFQGKALAPRYSNLEIPDMSVNATWEPGALELNAAYNGGSLHWDGTQLSLSNLPVTTGNLQFLVDANGSTAPLDLSYEAQLGGSLSGRVTGRYHTDTLEAHLDAAMADLRARGDLQGNTQSGWSGLITLSGLPKDSLLGTPDAAETAGQATLELTGDFAHPTLSGTARTLAAQLGVQANLNPLELKLNGVGNASGALTLRENKLGGSLQYNDGKLALNITGAGTLDAPAAELNATWGQVSARANLHLLRGQVEGTASLSDGAHSGSFTLEGEQLSGSITNFDLSSLEQAGYGGHVSLNAALTRDPKASLGWRGQIDAVWNQLVTPLEVPALGWKVDGTGRATLDTETGALSLQYQGTPGSATANLRLKNQLWQGTLNLDLRGANNQGSIKADLEIGENGINGTASAKALPLELLGIPITLSGSVQLQKDSFNANGVADALGGQVSVSGSGGLSDLVPMLETYTKTAPGELGYSLRARLDTVKLEDVSLIHQFAPQATGRAIGVVQITDGVSNFQVTVPELSLPALNGDLSQRVRLGLRITGTAAGSSLRYSGRINGLPEISNSLQPSFDGYGESLFNGSFDGHTASGLLEMRRAPLHSFIGAVIGPLPGSAIATGLARYNLVLGDFAKSELRVALEKLEVEGGGDKLVGAGALNFKNGNFTLDQLDLRGKGRWTGSGRYTHDAVDLNLDFENTSFTPVLALLPNLRDYNPDANGTVRLKLSGKYDNPNATLEVQNLRGTISNIALTAQRLDGSLQNGDFKLSGTIASDETLGAVLQTTATAKLESLSPLNITNLEAKANGKLNIRPVGLIDNVNARVYGASGGFKLDLTGTKGGPLSINGDLSPVLNLRLQGRNLAVPIPDYFVSDSLLDADISFKGDGAKSYLASGQISIARLSAALNQAQRNTNPSSTPTPTPTPAPTTNRRNPFLEQVKLGGIRINAPQGLRINESFATLEAGGTITLNGTAAAPEANGGFAALGSSSGRGTIRLGSNNYTIQQAAANFSPVDGLYPVISVDSKGKVRAQLRNINTKQLESKEIDVNLHLNISWVADARSGTRKLVIEPTLSSTPPSGYENLTQPELYSLVTLGSTLAFDAKGIGQQALDTAFSLFFLSEFSRQFKEATGIDLTVSTNLFDYIFNPSDSSLPQSEQNRLNFTFSLGFDLSRAVRLDVQLNTQGNGAVNINYQSEDGRFGIRFSTPFDLNANPDPNRLYGGLQPEFSLSYNISSLNAFTLGLQYLGANNFSFKFGFSFRF